MDTEKLLQLLKENKVLFVVIGATAFPVKVDPVFERVRSDLRLIEILKKVGMEK